MTLAGFAILLALVWIGMALSILRYLPRRQAATSLVILGAWVVYAGTMSWFGLTANTTMKPSPALFVAVPPFLAAVIFLALLPAGRRAALAFPLWLLLGGQAFRVGVELVLHALWRDGLVPRLMTYEGGNVDIAIGLSAPLVAWLAMRGGGGRRLAQIWNVIGLAALANIVIRAALTAPGPLKLLDSDVPNLSIATFPYTYIAAFLAPLALALHILAIRAIAADRSRTTNVP